MTEQERAWQAWWDSLPEDRASGYIELTRQAFFAGFAWKRERPKAKPLVTEDVAKTTYPRVSHDFLIGEWVRKNAIPEGTKIRVTAEEV